MRLIDKLSRRGAGNAYWEGVASGAAVLTTSYGSTNDREAVLPQLVAWAQQSYNSNSVVFSAILIRMMLLAEAVFQFQALDDKHLFGNTTLSILEKPWPNGTSGDLIARMEQDISLVGNAYIWNTGDDQLVRLRPDWTTIISELVTAPGGGTYRNKIGYWVEPPGAVMDRGKPRGTFYTADEVAHWAPLPDPLADFRGMSWLTPVYRDVKGDDGLGTYKVKYLENAATPNLLMRYPWKLAPGTVDAVRERVQARYAGADNAFKTIVMDGGSDATVIGSNLQEMDFSTVAAAGEQRILAAAMVPGVLVGLEPLRGAGRGYQESMQKFANVFARPEWRSLCGCLEQICPPPGAGSRLWFDTSDIAALQDGEMEKGQTALVKAQAMLALSQAGYTTESAAKYVDSMDVTLLEANPLPPPGAAPPQHLLPQAQPGATALPLPQTYASLPVGSTSPGDGGNNTRPTPKAAAGRRALTGANGHL